MQIDADPEVSVTIRHSLLLLQRKTCSHCFFFGPLLGDTGPEWIRLQLQASHWRRQNLNSCISVWLISELARGASTWRPSSFAFRVPSLPFIVHAYQRARPPFCRVSACCWPRGTSVEPERHTDRRALLEHQINWFCSATYPNQSKPMNELRVRRG